MDKNQSVHSALRFIHLRIEKLKNELAGPRSNISIKPVDREFKSAWATAWVCLPKCKYVRKSSQRTTSGVILQALSIFFSFVKSLSLSLSLSL